MKLTLTLLLIPCVWGSYNCFYQESEQLPSKRSVRNMIHRRISVGKARSGKSSREPSGGQSTGKGGKGKGGDDTLPTPTCETIEVWALRSEILANARVTDVGTVIDPFPMRNLTTGAQVGVISESSTRLMQGTTETSMGTNLYSFFDEQGNIGSQIQVSFGLDGPFQIIQGGSGDFACANGYGELDASLERVNITLSLCGPLCPP